MAGFAGATGGRGVGRCGRCKHMAIVTQHQVQTIGRHVRREMRAAASMAIWVATAKRVIERFVGSDWTAQHLGATPLAFFQAYDTPTMRDNAGARRVLELAEMLLNLQSVSGFNDPLNKLRDDKVETAFAALEAAKLLHRSKTPFAFVAPTGATKANYDIEAFPRNGPAVPIEAKCKLISTAVGESGVKSTLERARTQLPERRPGVIMLRIPREWGGEDFLTNRFGQLAGKLLRNSSRVAGVIAFSNTFIAQGGLHTTYHVVRDIWSERPEFAEAPRWRLVRSGVYDETDTWLSIRVLLGYKPPFGITAEQARERFGIED